MVSSSFSDRRRRRVAGLALLPVLALGGCAYVPKLAPPSFGPPRVAEWVKSGADQHATDQALGTCRALADAADRTTQHIDEDIDASRSGDWQRAGTAQVESGVTMTDTARSRAKIIANCMMKQGFVNAA
jgi:hypothetical protein